MNTLQKCLPVLTENNCLESKTHAFKSIAKVKLMFKNKENKTLNYPCEFCISAVLVLSLTQRKTNLCLVWETIKRL
jgi:hypothetical protein